MLTKVVSCGLLLIAWASASAGPLDGALDALARVHQFREVAVSPDGAMAAWVESIPSKDGSPGGRSMIYVQDLRDAAATLRRVTDAPETGEGLAWSRDGKLAFLSNGDSGEQLQLYVADKPGRGHARRLTNVQGYLASRNGPPMDGPSQFCGSRD